MKFATKPMWRYPPHLRHVATPPGEIRNSNFFQIFTRCGRKCRQIAFWVHRLFYRLSGEATKNTFFVHIEDKASGRLWELLKQKLSALRVSSAVRVCQLLCMVPLETFQTQVFTNSPGQRRPMNTRLPWYLTDSPVGLQLVLLTRD